MSTMSDNLSLTKATAPFRVKVLSKRIQILLDFSVLVAGFVFAYQLRFDFSLPEKEFQRALSQLPYVVLIQFTALFLMGVYKFIWRYIGLSEVKRFIVAALLSAVPLLLLRILLPFSLREWRVPISIILIDTCLSFGGILALRVARRDLYERKRRKATKVSTGQRKPILLIGAGRAGILAAGEIQSHGDTDLEIKGFIDDDTAKKGSRINGVKVLGTTQDLPRWVRELKVDHVVISIAQASRQEFKRILEVCDRVPVKVRIIPGLHEILQGKLKISRVRDVQIEDLLGRDPVRLDEVSMREFLTGKTVMVTGAGGSIGSELVRQVACFNPTSLILVERAEFALFNIEQELRRTCPSLPISPLVSDVGDEMRMRAILRTHRPQVILHAAAHKHVPMMETNIAESVKNNILNTRLLGDLAGEFNVDTFVLISTDKAVRPTSIMGATKRVAELVIQELNCRHQTRFVAVRFGNVIGSAGSVIPIFRDQILRGGPITVTHPDMVRYFMTIPEASQLVLQAGAIGKGGEIFILDMGEPIRIIDLARETIKLSGLRPYEDIDIIFTGIRPGEKLFEELEVTGENLTKTRHPKIFIGLISAYPPEVVNRALERLTILSRRGLDQEICKALQELLPESRFELKDKPVAQPSETPLTLAATMH